MKSSRVLLFCTFLLACIVHPLTAAAGDAPCGNATQGALVHDDGNVDTNYWLTLRADAAAVEKFTPTSYPNSFSTACFQLITTNASQTTLNFTILVFDDDGPDGAPGTLLGSKPASSTQLHVATSSAAYPFAATFESFDIADLGLDITSGSVYIGATWDSRSTAFPNAKLGLDTSANTVVGNGYRRLTGTSAWGRIVDSTPTYRALFVRAVQSTTVTPSLTKTFTPETVSAGTPSRLTLTLNNSANVPATLTADLVDTLPTGLVIAPTPNAATDCGGTLTANAGEGAVTLASGAVIPPAASCTVGVDVAAAEPGTYVNTLAAGALQTDQGGNANAANASLSVSVASGPPTVSKVFEPASIFPYEQSTLTITLNNGNTSAATLSANLADTFPAGIVLTANPSPTTNCAAGLLDTTANSLTLRAGAAIPATGSCTLSVKVTAASGASSGDHLNTIPAGALQTDQGNNTDAADATLFVRPAPTLAKAFEPATIGIGETSRLTITLGNPNATALTLTANLNDQFPSGLVIATPADAATTCTGGAGVSTTADSVVLGSGAQIPANGSCTLSVDATSDEAQSYVNQLGAGALQTDQGRNATPASATLSVKRLTDPPSATVTPTSLSMTVDAHATATATFNIANAANSDPLTYSIAAHATEAAPQRFTLGLSKRAPKRFAIAGRATLSVLPWPNPTRHAAPWIPAGSLVFQLDDGSYEGRVGFGSVDNNTESAAVWINRFTVAGATTIDSISILWPVQPQPTDTVVGLQPNLVAYYDADGDGDPGNAVRLGTDTLVTIAGLDAFETYPTNFEVPGAGDVYIGFVDQWAADGTFSPLLRPAAIDRTASQGRSYLSAGSTQPTDVDTLANNDTTGTVDSLGSPGNWLIRATGSGSGPCSGPVVSWLTTAPASGTVAGGANVNVTVTADPSAAALAPGSYTADLCLTTNDPAHALIAVAVALTVTGGPCSADDEIFCDGFDGSGAPAQPVQDASFETSALERAAGAWESHDTATEASDHSALYRRADVDALPTRSGDAAAWFGGWDGGAQTQYVAQRVTIPAAAPLYLNYWRYVQTPADAHAALTVSIDGRVVQTQSAAAEADRGFVPQSIALDGYADGHAHEIRFQYRYEGRGKRDGNVFVDEVTIERTPLVADDAQR